MDHTPPLKRHQALQPLSREHMGGLIHARNLLRVAANSSVPARAAVDRFIKDWHDEIADHFHDEERLLLPLTESAVLRNRLLSEHETLRQLASCCQSDPAGAATNLSMLHQLGTLLHDHIRWEERILFEAIQRDHPEALAALLGESAQIERDRPGSRPRYRLDQRDCAPGTGTAS